MKYLKENWKSEFVRNALISHLGQEQLIRQLQAIGLVGKLITGPWMKFVCKNEQELLNLQMSGHFRTALSVTEAWSTNPSEMVQSTRDIFQQTLIHDAVIESFQSETTDKVRKENFAYIFKDAWTASYSKDKIIKSLRQLGFVLGILSIWTTNSVMPQRFLKNTCANVSESYTIFFS